MGKGEKQGVAGVCRGEREGHEVELAGFWVWARVFPRPLRLCDPRQYGVENGSTGSGGIALRGAGGVMKIPALWFYAVLHKLIHCSFRYSPWFVNFSRTPPQSPATM